MKMEERENSNKKRKIMEDRWIIIRKQIKKFVKEWRKIKEGRKQGKKGKLWER